jgi:hypothetical protein
MSKTKSNKVTDAFSNLFHYLNNTVDSLNNSKFFAGLMIITLNIASKFVTIRLSKSMESYLKFTFSRNILIFAIAWMGTREIYIACIITFLFIFLMDYILNEDSKLCCLPENFTDYHVDLLDNVSDDDIKKAKEVLEKAEKQTQNKIKEEGSTTPPLNNNNNNNDTTNNKAPSTYSWF